MENVYVVLGSSGEWRSWVEGVFFTREAAQERMQEVRDGGDWEISYYVEEGILRGRIRWAK